MARVTGHDMTGNSQRQSNQLRLLLGSILVVLAILSFLPEKASAHAFLESSDPLSNAVLADSPVRVRMRFTEPLERAASTKAVLYDQEGTLIEGTRLEFDDQDRHVMFLVLPDRLERGTYSVVWQTLSSADGHRAQGYIPFTVGTVDDVRSVIPPALQGNAGPPGWLQTLARWISYLGLAITVGVFPIWLLVLRPAISPAWQAGPRLTRRVRTIGYLGVAIALFGSLLALYVQIDGARDDTGFFSAILTTVSDTRLGRIWILRVVLLLASAVALMGAAWWWPRRQKLLTLVTLAVTLAAPLPFALVSHASAQTYGRSTAIAFDMAHLLGASLWIGGLFVLVGGLLPTLRDLTPAGRRVVMTRALPRFSAVGLTAWAVLVISGAYAGWLQVGSWKALRNTDYGTSLTIKLLLIVPLLLLAAFNLLIVTRRLKKAKTDKATAIWSKRFKAAIVAEVVIAIIVLLVVGRMTSQAPARDTLAQDENQIDLVFELQDRTATFSLAPGKAGPNHYRLDIGGDPLAADVEAILRLTVPNLKTGAKEVALERVSGNAFETHGSEVSIAGDWGVEVIVREIGGFNWATTVTLPIEQASTGQEIRRAWSFGPVGILGLLMFAAGFAGCAFAWWTGKGALRKESAGFGVVAIALGALLLLQARVTIAEGLALNTPNPIPSDTASIERGAALYQANCIECHGVSGEGDGPLASSFTPPAADFTTAHAKAHLDAEFFNWIRDGKPLTAMPAFGENLTNDQIWDVVNYVRDIQTGSSAPTAATPADTTVATPTQ